MKKNPDVITLKVTRQRAKELGLLTCFNCSYPENNHFDFAPKKCAHDLRCPGFVETGTRGILIVR